MRRLLAVHLAGAGLAVDEAEDGAELLARLRAGGDGYALLVTDVHMPRLSGLEAIRRAGEAARVPTIVVTSFGDDEVHRKAEAMGALAVLDKPFDFDAFMAAVRGALPGLDGA
ncbi:MAG: response regulator [Myxococcales bacterium]|nr:response regulator [Myxococcales bacterium]MCB9735459.1 response regulator [Deltaproteobacteria bacterium]